MVSLLIGHKGRQIRPIMTESNTKIAVDQEHGRKTDFRSVAIRGEPAAIKKAAKLIINLVEQMLCKLQNTEFRKRPEIDKRAKITSKLVLSKEAESDVIGVNGVIAEGLSTQFDVKIVLKLNKKIKSMENNDTILVGVSFYH